MRLKLTTDDLDLFVLAVVKDDQDLEKNSMWTMIKEFSICFIDQDQSDDYYRGFAVACIGLETMLTQAVGTEHAQSMAQELLRAASRALMAARANRSMKEEVR